MTPYQKALARIPISRPPTLPHTHVSLTLERLILWILCPHEPVSEEGILNPRYVTKEIADFLSSHPHLPLHAVLEQCSDGIRLWRKKDWDGKYSEWLRRKQENEAITIANIEKRERIERVISNLPAAVKGLSQELVYSLVLNMVKKAEEGDESHREMLEKYEYYENT